MPQQLRTVTPPLQGTVSHKLLSAHEHDLGDVKSSLLLLPVLHLSLPRCSLHVWTSVLIVTATQAWQHCKCVTHQAPGENH